MPFLAVIPATMMIPMNDEMLSVMPVTSSAMKLPARHDIAAIRHARAGASRANSQTSIRNIMNVPATSTSASSWNACCC